jgi:hypothetical protein
MRRILLWLALLAACNGGGEPDADPGCHVMGDPEIELGVPDSITFLDFEPLGSDGEIPLSSNGQTFLAVQVAVRGKNFGHFAYIGMTVTYVPETGEPRTSVKDDSELERLFCRSDDRLYLVPVVVSSEMLGDDIEIQDKPVDVSVTVTDQEGRDATAMASGVLRRI